MQTKQACLLSQAAYACPKLLQGLQTQLSPNSVRFFNAHVLALLLLLPGPALTVIISVPLPVIPIPMPASQSASVTERLGTLNLPRARCKHAGMSIHLSLFLSLSWALSLSLSLSLPLSRSLCSLSCPRSLSLLGSPWRSLSLPLTRSLSRCLQSCSRVSLYVVWHGIMYIGFPCCT